MLLVPPEPLPKAIDGAEFHPPPWWRHAYDPITGRRGAIVRLPCGHIVSIGFLRDGLSHTLGPDGAVTPSVVCPEHKPLTDGKPNPVPGFHDYIRLLDYAP